MIRKKIIDIIIDEQYDGKSVKEIMYDRNLSNRIIRTIKNSDGIWVNDKSVNVNVVLKIGDTLQLFINDDNSENIMPEQMELDIIYEDDEILLINKPAKLVVHPTTYHFTGTLANGVMHYFNSKNIHFKFRPVNRLDKDTSGLVLIAKSQLSHSILSNQLINKDFKKEYIAVVHNSFEQKEGEINAPISRKPGSIIERYVHESGQDAVTQFIIESQNDAAALVRINLLTGRTHQIRVHFSHIGHPLFGDEIYGQKDEFIDRQALHCIKLEFKHPTTKKNIKFEANIPNDIKNLIENLGLDKLS